VSAFDDLTAIPPQELAAGYLARAVHGERITLAIVEIEPGAELPEHLHANEQFGLVLRGADPPRRGRGADGGSGRRLAHPRRHAALGEGGAGGRRRRRRLLPAAGRLGRDHSDGAEPAGVALT
jgi:hypothetical protein